MGLPYKLGIENFKRNEHYEELICFLSFEILNFHLLCEFSLVSF